MRYGVDALIRAGKLLPPVRAKAEYKTFTERHKASVTDARDAAKLFDHKGQNLSLKIY